ncbi:hypothetical protein K1T71_014250 [Dendrolimus kikuchii]|uniref:Uncharacterized protein n=1 Tax=Dendrolimus kikuchii TaxID=765133 RepID=A0ACC1CFQ1_9NEOP|nr:hypothetical protein K1T71_014250 [Dendrolimus kikuchii]
MRLRIIIVMAAFVSMASSLPRRRNRVCQQRQQNPTVIVLNNIITDKDICNPVKKGGCNELILPPVPPPLEMPCKKGYVHTLPSITNLPFIEAVPPCSCVNLPIAPCVSMATPLCIDYLALAQPVIL